VTILDQILATKRVEVERLRATISDVSLRQQAEMAPPLRGFLQSLRVHPPVALIAEIKKASPSKGVIEPNFRPVEMALAYGRAGAACLSVLTDETYFQGHNSVLIDVRQNCQLPILRKDFVIDERQIWEARVIGADAVLLIVAAIQDDGSLRHLYDTARALGMDVLVEVHTEQEATRAAKLDAPLIGINNRDLRTFAVDLDQTARVATCLAPGTLLVSESGLASAHDVAHVHRAGARAVLVGETLMRFGVEGVLQGVSDLFAEVGA